MSLISHCGLQDDGDYNLKNGEVSTGVSDFSNFTNTIVHNGLIIYTYLTDTFYLCNRVLLILNYRLPCYFQTTIIAASYNGGVVIGADSRTTTG